MDNRITFKQYRNVDLFIFSLITAVGEGVATFATSRWFVGQPMAISITLAMILIGEATSKYSTSSTIEAL